MANGPNLDTTLQDHIWDKMSTVLTAMDGEKYIGDEASLGIETSSLLLALSYGLIRMQISTRSRRNH